MKIVADDKIPFIKGVFEPYAEVVYLPGGAFTRENVADADALVIRTRTKCNKALLEGTSVKFIATATIGYDHIDTAWCESAGIAWTNAPGCNSGSVRQYIASVLASLSVRFGFAFEDMTLGVVGVGNVGSKVARLGKALGMKVLLNDPPRARKEGPAHFVSLDEIFRASNIITLHVPLNLTGDDKTRHMFDEAVFRRLPRETILINSSRGEVVDNFALKNVLKSNSGVSAVLDVWENEPNIDRELLSLLQIATPHIAGYSADGKALGTAMSVRAVSRFFGLPSVDWQPGEVPVPERSLRFTLDCMGKSDRQCLCEAVRYTYSVNDEDRRLRDSPETFEKQRGDYPVRREFEAFTVNLVNARSGIEERLRALGLNIS